MKYRSRTDIVHLILEAANGGASYKIKDNVQSVLVLRTVKRIFDGSNRERSVGIRRRTEYI